MKDEEFKNTSAKKSLKGTWDQAILTFLFPIVLVLSVRWALIEPFVIPSGSMIPNLLIHDHILVQKFAYGLRWPFADRWMLTWSSPQRGDIVVFKYPENPEVYYIKRLIGLPGDSIELRNGRISVNQKELGLKEMSAQESYAEGGVDEFEDFQYFKENNGNREYTVQFLSEIEDDKVPDVFKVPEAHYFFMGDNRDQSSDSRSWGFVKKDFIVGRASLIWLSCSSTLPTMTFVCNPSQIRWSRVFKTLQ